MISYNMISRQYDALEPARLATAGTKVATRKSRDAVGPRHGCPVRFGRFPFCRFGITLVKLWFPLSVLPLLPTRRFSDYVFRFAGCAKCRPMLSGTVESLSLSLYIYIYTHMCIYVSDIYAVIYPR